VKVDPAMLDEALERVDISLRRRVLHRLDSMARSAGETRSGFIARMRLREDASRPGLHDAARSSLQVACTSPS
jgi:metal-responsive CopG/Arc/MetJ family transcriptional regulator